MRTLKEAIAESTCQKRVVVCDIFDAKGNLLARESNRCDPEGGVCHRIGVEHHQGNYPADSSCNWTHAEVRALQAQPVGTKAFMAFVYGHEFACKECLKALGTAGIPERLVFCSPMPSPYVQDAVAMLEEAGYSAWIRNEVLFMEKRFPNNKKLEYRYFMTEIEKFASVSWSLKDYFLLVHGL